MKRKKKATSSRRVSRRPPARKRVSSAPRLILLPERGNPLVYLEIAVLNGSLRDPQGKEGTASLMLSMLLRGTRGKDAQEFHRILDNLGGEIHLGKYKESQRIYGVCLASKLPEFLELLEEMLTEPAFPEEELRKVREQMRSALLDELGSDDEIADRRFQEYLFWGSPYGRMTSGTMESLERISADDLRDFHQRFFRRDDLVVGAAGGFDRGAFGLRLKSMLAKFPDGSAGEAEAVAPVIPSGKNLLLLDKADRTQAQLYIGSSGIAFSDKDYFAMLVGNHVFGGSSFSARLMREVREKRGWSYGCYSWYRAGRQPLYLGMHAVPSNKDVLPALQLMLHLFRRYAKDGITKEEFDFAKKSLVNQSAFLQDTLRKRLDNKVTEVVLGLAPGFYDDYQRHLQRLTHAHVQRAIRRHVDPRRIFALVLGTIDQLGITAQATKGITRVWQRRFDEPAVGLRALPGPL